MTRRRSRNQKRKNRTGRCDFHRPASSGWLRFKIVIPKGRRIRILVYARYSSEEQNPLSIDDQVAFCKRFLADCGIKDFESSILFDSAISGERISRPGIDEMKKGIREKSWDLIVAEDSSRIYRNETACMELFGDAVDRKIRIVCCNDYVDTADEDWPDRLHDSQRHHSKSNYFTSRRIKRAHDALFEKGAALGPLRSGYRREATYAATRTDPEEGPFFDSVDPRWSPIIKEAFQRIATGDATRDVANWLTNQGLPKRENAVKEKWDDKNVISLVRNKIYRGVRQFRITITKKHYGSGKRRQVKNEEANILKCEMPDLRVVADYLWYRANDAIDSRISTENRKHGDEHPLSGIPRNSRMPLSGLFFCYICGAKMHVIGNNGYRCSQAKAKECWNRASAKVDVVHAAISESLIRELQNQLSHLEEFRQKICDLLHDGGERTRKIEQKIKKENNLKIKMDIFAESIAEGNIPDFLVEKANELEEDYVRTKAEREELQQSEQTDRCTSLEKLTKHIRELIEELRSIDRNDKGLIQKLAGKILAVPHRQFHSDRVVLRGRFEFHPDAILTASTLLALKRLCGDDLSQHFPTIALEVELFRRPRGTEFWERALEFKESEKISLEALGNKLGTSKRGAHLALQFGKTMREAGRTDPYIELTEPPATACRWR